MLAVTIEVWPGGRILQRRIIGTLNLANISSLSEISDYEGYLDDEFVELSGHERSKGAWELVRRILNENLPPENARMEQLRKARNAAVANGQVLKAGSIDLQMKALERIRRDLRSAKNLPDAP